MGKPINKSDFGYLDISFQYKLVKTFMEEPKFFGEVFSIIDQNAFTEPILRSFVGNIKDYYNENSLVPTYETISTILKSKARTTTDIEEIEGLLVKLKKEVDLEGYSVVKETALKFFKQQNLIKVANKILDIAGKGDIDKYDECQKLMEDAALAGQEDEYGVSPYDLMEKALSPTYKCPIPTGVAFLDEVLNGGLDKGKIGLIIGSAGFGKSTFSTAIAAYASTYRCDMNNNEGFKVLQIYFEDDDVDITRKHFSRITQTEARYLTKDPVQIDEIREVLNNYPEKELMKNNLRLKRFNTNTKSASDIENFIKKLTNTGFKPDLVIIDYFECLSPERGGYSTDSKWDRETTTMRKIENMAKDLNIAIWVPTQGNRDSVTCADVVTMDKGSGAYTKVQIAQVVISIARSLDAIDKSLATLAVLKNRSGKSGSVFEDIKFNNGTSTISCDNATTFDEALIYQEHAKENLENNRIELQRRIFNSVQRNENPNKDFEAVTD